MSETQTDLLRDLTARVVFLQAREELLRDAFLQWIERIEPGSGDQFLTDYQKRYADLVRKHLYEIPQFESALLNQIKTDLGLDS